MLLLRPSGYERGPFESRNVLLLLLLLRRYVTAITGLERTGLSNRARRQKYSTNPLIRLRLSS